MSRYNLGKQYFLDVVYILSNFYLNQKSINHIKIGRGSIKKLFS